jgi:hypothetical protein
MGVVRSPWLLTKKKLFVVVVIEVWSWKNLGYHKVEEA